MKPRSIFRRQQLGVPFAGQQLPQESSPILWENRTPWQAVRGFPVPGERVILAVERTWRMFRTLSGPFGKARRHLGLCLP